MKTQPIGYIGLLLPPVLHLIHSEDGPQIYKLIVNVSLLTWQLSCPAPPSAISAEIIC